jgi:hypothetical protein
MRKICVAISFLGLLVVLPGTAGAATLGQRVAKLEAKMACLKRTPMATWFGYAWYEGNVGDPGPFPVHDPATDLILDSLLAANFSQATGGGADYWVVTVRNTATCRGRFGVVTNPYARQVTNRAVYERQLARVR